MKRLFVLPIDSRAVAPFLAGLMLLLGTLRGGADVAFFASADENENPFREAAAAAELMLLGRESFPSVGAEESGSTPGSLLAPGVQAGPLFPSGSNGTLGLLFQTNSLGDNPSAPSAGGTIFAVGPTADEVRAWIGPNLSTDSLDVFVDPPAYRARAQAMSFAVRTTAGAPVTVRLYDNENTLLASETFNSGNLERIGVLSSSQHLFRVNIHAPGGYLDVASIDLYVSGEISEVPGSLGDLITRYFPGADLQSFDPAEDHNGSGLATLAELAFGNNPAVAGAPRFRVELVSGPEPLILTHPLDRAVDGILAVEVAWSTDLHVWSPVQPGVAGVTREVETEAYRAAANGDEPVSAVDRVRITIPTGAEPSGFVHVRVKAAD
jgi:hypothetical protein